MTNTTSRFADVYQQARSNPIDFWAEAAAELEWIKPWKQVFNPDNEYIGEWFKGGQINTCHNALDRHVKHGGGHRTAVIYDSAMTGERRQISYSELTELVARCAGMLASRGVGKGDRVVIYMPMIPEAIIAMLACARIGAIHSVVFGGFAAEELAKRIEDAEPRAILAASCGLEPGRTIDYMHLVNDALDICTHEVDFCCVKQRPELKAELQPKRDVDWDEALRTATAVPCVPVDATDPLYILYTSGTTGSPKGVVRDNGGHAVAMNWSLRHIYGMQPGEVFWAASDVGWVVGHSYIVYAPLLLGCTTVLYEGKPVGTPDPGAFFRVIDEYKVKVLFTAPTAFRAIRREDPDGTYIRSAGLGSLNTLFLAGERCDPDTLAWAHQLLGVPVIDHWWQTETGWTIAGIACGIEMLTVKPGAAGLPMPGYTVDVLDEAGEAVDQGEIGNIAIKLPLPPGSLTTLWRDHERFANSYMARFPGYYLTGDAGFIDDEGYIHIMSRTDDVINVAGHRLSTGGIEEVLAEHEAVAECAVVGMADDLKGQLPVGLVVLKNRVAMPDNEIRRELIQNVRNRIGPVAAFKQVVIVDRLPKTRSGKVLRGAMKRLADGERIPPPPTIDDPAIIAEIREKFIDAGVLDNPK